MKHARIVSGEFKDAFGGLDNIANDDGSINWGVAFRADPGVTHCPQCKTHYWNEAAVLECPDCKVLFGSGVRVTTGDGASLNEGSL